MITLVPKTKPKFILKMDFLVGSGDKNAKSYYFEHCKFSTFKFSTLISKIAPPNLKTKSTQGKFKRDILVCCSISAGFR